MLADEFYTHPDAVLLPNLSEREGGAEEKKKKGGIRFRLTVRESEAGLVQHLLSR